MPIALGVRGLGVGGGRGGELPQPLPDYLWWALDCSTWPTPTYASSKVNRVNPGVNDLTDVIAPSWDGAVGWLDDYVGGKALDTGLLLSPGWTYQVAFDWGGSTYPVASLFGASDDPRTWSMYMKPLVSSLGGYWQGKVAAGDGTENIFYTPSSNPSPKWACYVDDTVSPVAYYHGVPATWSSSPPGMFEPSELSSYVLSWHDPSGIRDAAQAPTHGLAIWKSQLTDAQVLAWYDAMTSWQAGG